MLREFRLKQLTAAADSLNKKWNVWFQYERRLTEKPILYYVKRILYLSCKLNICKKFFEQFLDNT